jgi:hypothetical protein
MYLQVKTSDSATHDGNQLLQSTVYVFTTEDVNPILWLYLTSILPLPNQENNSTEIVEKWKQYR